MSAARRCSKKFASFRSITSPGPRSIFWIDIAPKSRRSLDRTSSSSDLALAQAPRRGSSLKPRKTGRLCPGRYLREAIAQIELRVSERFFPISKSCRSAPITCNLSYCLHRVTKPHVMLFIFPDPLSAISNQMKPSSFLRRIANVSGPGGGLLIGVDLQKDQNVIEAAYNDKAGVTAEFNLNLTGAHQSRDSVQISI